MSVPQIPHLIFLTYQRPNYYVAECISCFWRVSGGYNKVTTKADSHKESHKEELQ